MGQGFKREHFIFRRLVAAWLRCRASPFISFSEVGDESALAPRERVQVEGEGRRVCTVSL